LLIQELNRLILGTLIDAENLNRWILNLPNQLIRLVSAFIIWKTLSGVTIFLHSPSESWRNKFGGGGMLRFPPMH